MQVLGKTLLMICLGSLFTACADHSFSELKTAAFQDSGEVEPQPEEPTPVEPNPEEPKPVDPVPVEPEPEVPKPLKAPEIVWIQVPNTALGTDDTITVVYEVIEGTSPVVKAVCQLDGKVIACDKDGDTLTFKDGKPGEHKLEIKVVDADGLEDNDSATWELFERFQKVKTPLAIADADDQVDVLFVIDNSRSMIDEQKNMATRISNFMDRVKGLNWRIGIITTDYRDVAYGQGRLLQYPNKTYFLNSSMDIEEARKQFGETIQRKESGDSAEQGIRATYKAITRAFTGAAGIDQQHKAFFRKDAALAVVVITDEDESANLSTNKGANLKKYIADQFGADKIFKFHSIIVRPGDDKCLKKSIDHKTGKAYAELTALTGGKLGDICAADYGNQLDVIGQDVANTQNTFALTCLPKDINGDGTPDVTVTSTSGTKVPNFVIKNDTIVFSSAPAAGKYSIDYFCPKK